MTLVYKGSISLQRVSLFVFRGNVKIEPRLESLTNDNAHRSTHALSYLHIYTSLYSFRKLYNFDRTLYIYQPTTKVRGSMMWDEERNQKVQTKVLWPQWIAGFGGKPIIIHSNHRVYPLHALYTTEASRHAEQSGFLISSQFSY